MSILISTVDLLRPNDFMKTMRDHNVPPGKMISDHLMQKTYGEGLWFVCFLLPDEERFGKQYKIVDKEIRRGYEGTVIWHKDNNVHDAEYSGLKQAGRAAMGFYRSTIFAVRQDIGVYKPYMFGFSNVVESVITLRLRFDANWVFAKEVSKIWLENCQRRFNSWDIPLLSAERKRYKPDSDEYADITKAIQISVNAALRDDMLELCKTEMNGHPLERHAELSMRREHSWLFV